MRHSFLWKSIVCLLTTMFAVCACTTVKWVSVERLQPVRTKVPAQVRRVAVVNNQPDLSKKNRYSRDLKALDSKMVVDSLAQYLADAAYFDEVVVYDSVLTTEPMLSCDERELSPVRVKQLADQLQVDMLVSVEMAALLLEYSAYMGGQVFTIVKLYLPGELYPLDTIRCIQRLDADELYPLELIPVQEAAFLPLASLVPQWQTIEFPFYTGANVEMRDAAVYVNEGNWQAAKTLWEKQLKHKNSRRRMEAHLNMAVWHELNDDSIGTARSYAEKALELSARKMKKGEDGRWKNQTSDYLFISDYLRDMEKRGKEMEQLKRQMWRFSDDF